MNDGGLAQAQIFAQTQDPGLWDGITERPLALLAVG